MRFFAYTNGDPSVGIGGETATVDIRVDHLEGQDQADYIKEIKIRLVDAFSKLWGFPVGVWTKEEAEAETRKFKEAADEPVSHEFQPVYRDKDSGQVWGYFHPLSNGE